MNRHFILPKHRPRHFFCLKKQRVASFLHGLFFFIIVATLPSGIFLVAPHAHASEITLGSEGEHIFYYLVLTDALVEGDETSIEHSIEGLLKEQPSLPVYQDGVTILLSRKNYPAAFRLVKEGLKNFPDDPLLTILLAGVFSDSGDIAKAIDLLKAYLGKHLDNRDAKQELMRLYLKTGEDSKAQLLLKDLGGEEESPAITFFRSKLLTTTGNYTKAKIELQKLVTAYPEFVEAWLELGFIAEKENKFSNAIGFYRRAMGIMHDNSEVRFRIFQLLIKGKNIKDALLTAKQSTDPAVFNLQAGLYLAEEGYFSEGKKLIDLAKLAGAKPDDTATFLSAIVYNETKDPMKAIEPLDTFLKTDPANVGISQRKVELLLDGKDFKGANIEAANLRNRFPANTELWGLEAYTFLKLDQPQKSIALLKDGLKINPDDENLLFALGSIFDEIGKKSEAIDTMERIIVINPKNAKALNYIAYTLALENRDLDRALKLVSTALEELPNAQFIIDSLAWVHYKRGEYEQAWTEIQRCLDLAKEDPTIWEHYADIAAKLKKKKEAVKGYKEALKLHPENEFELRSKLKVLE